MMMVGSQEVARVWRTTVRAADCDWFGHANNAVYADYVISATIVAWRADYDAAAWRMRSMEMDFERPVTQGDEIEVRSWKAGILDGMPRSAHRIVNRGTGEEIAAAVVVWSRPKDDAPGPWEKESVDVPPNLRSAPAKPNRPDAHVYRRKHLIQAFAADYSGYVNPTWIFRWGWASMFAATAQVGWPQERMDAAGFISYQRHRSAELFAPLRAGDEIEVQSRLFDLHRIRGTWEHRVLHNGELVAIDRAEGAFLNREGRIAPAPVGLMESLLAGGDVSGTSGAEAD